jgi:signal transduction histidine kinase
MVGQRADAPILQVTDPLLLACLMIAMLVMFQRQYDSLTDLAAMSLIAGLLFVWACLAARNAAELRNRLAATERGVIERQAAEAIGRLTGGVAHDFNNILTVIGGNLELAREVSDPVERNSLLAEARAATGRAAAVTAQLLAYSRQTVLLPVPTDLTLPLARVEGFMLRLLPPKIRLACAVADDLPAVLLDPTQLETALINLILNANDAMPNGGLVRVDVDTPSWIDGPPAWVVVTVSDEGVGIPPDLLDRVVEPYFTTKQPGKGSGLGLSMVKGFVEQSGGRMEIVSAQNRGTVVTLWFPVIATA